MKNKFKTISSTAVPLPVENIDTDQIIPARFLKATTKDGFGKNLFVDWRREPGFVLNDKKFKGEILVAGRNFGCGSSREHAAWAIRGYGFKAVISSFFADIFRANALNNGLLPVQISQGFLDAILETVKKNPETIIRIDLESETVEVPSIGKRERFPIDPYKKNCILNGYNDIDYILSIRDEIQKFENSRSTTV